VSGGASIVVASFNQPRTLRLVFRGIFALERAPDEVLVADDGSEQDTAELVREIASGAPFPVRFTTQENRGFRKARALNNALRIAGGDLVLFLDGDCIPHRQWLGAHVDALRAGAGYATGGYVHLDLAQAERLEAPGVSAEGFLDAAERRRLRRLHWRQRFHLWRGTPDKPKILGGNWSARMEALRIVNGFDERYDGFGKEDSDIRNRLNASGVRAASVWDRAFVFHCPHEMDPRRTAPGEVRGAPDRGYYYRRRGARRCAAGLVYDPSAEDGAPQPRGSPAAS
jgi:glycosyltransferase involved in cell wall biosynthesis